MKNPLGVSPSKGNQRTVDLILRSWVGFLPRSKDFFFTSCGSLIPRIFRATFMTMPSYFCTPSHAQYVAVLVKFMTF